jgi:zinc protease
MNALKEVLEIKVTQHLREDESEVYSPSVEVNYVRNPTARYRFTFSFGCAPANTDHLMDQVDKEIKTLRDHGPAPEDLDKFKAESRRLYETQLKDNEFWLGYLTGQYQNHENPTQILYYLNRLNKLKPEELQHAANMFLSGDSEIRFELLPETH